MMKITIFGDICPTKDTQDAFNRGDAEAIFGETLQEIESSDIVIGNLECAVTDNPTPIKKTGPILYTTAKSIETLRGFTALSLANNHIRDCGEDGVKTAIETCHKLGIVTFGAGQELSEAKEPLVIEKKGIKVGFMSFAEQEFNTASKDRAGAAYLDLYDDFDRIREFRKTVDYLIILYHGGIEYFPYASPDLKRKCRKFVDCGADIVTCQHSHCIGMTENYKGATIVYGQGNSIFGYREGDSSWNTGLLLQIYIRDTGIATSFLGIKATSSGLKFLNKTDQIELDQLLLGRTLLSEDKIQEEWDMFCKQHALIHLPLLLGWPRILIALNRRTNNLLVRILYGRKKQNVSHNIMRCEALYEAIRNILSKMDFE